MLAGEILLNDNRCMRCLLACLLTVTLLTACSRSDNVSNVDVTTNPDTGLNAWKTRDQAFSLELVPLLPDFVRAVFMAKQLPANVVEAVSGYCVFGTIVRNEADVPVSYDMRTWRYITEDGVEHRAKPKSEWVEEWREQDIAFRWTLLYETQTYAVGDWGQGFTTVKLAPGTRFDLHYNWQQVGETHARVIKDITCAPATLPDR